MENTSKISLRYFADAVRTRLRLAAAVAGGIFVALVALIFWLDPRYTSTAVVLLAPTAEQLSGDTSGHSAIMTDPFFVHSETDILSSDELSRSVIASLHLDANPEFLPKPGLLDLLGISHKKDDGVLSQREVLLDNVVRHYQDKLYVFNDGKSNTVEIQFTALDPREAAAIANAHADAYLQQQWKRRNDTERRATEWLAREVDARAAEVRDADTRVQQYQLSHGIVKTNDSTLVEQRLAQLNSQLIDATRNLSNQNAVLEEIHQIRKGGDAGNASTMLADEPLQKLLQSRVDAEADIASMQTRLASTHPNLIKRRQELTSINNVLNEQLARMEKEARSNASWWQRQVTDVRSAVDRETAAKVGEDKVAAGLPALTAQAAVKRAVFETVLNRYQTLLAERAFAAPGAAVVSRAVPSARPSFPKKALFMVIALLLAGMLGAVAAILAELRTSTQEVSGLAEALGVKRLALIPRFKNATETTGVTEIKDPRLFIESIRFLRDAVLGRPSGRASTICLITSVRPRQGKSLVAMSLARAIARTRRRTLFIELDLRQPSASFLARRTQPETGIAAVLEGRESLQDVVVRDEGTGLEMLLAEGNAASALERLNASVLEGLVAQLRSRYSVVIIDSPPVGVVADALTLLPLVDQTIVVAKDGENSLPDLQGGFRLLAERGAKQLGLVITAVDPRRFPGVDERTLHRYARGVQSGTPRTERRESVAVG
jgi:polysaccharide biosynthesis transport protein